MKRVWCTYDIERGIKGRDIFVEREWLMNVVGGRECEK